MYFPSSWSPHCPSLFFLVRGNLCLKESWVQVCSCVTVSHSHYRIFPPLNVKCLVTLTVMCQGFLLKTVDKRNLLRKSWHYCCAFSFVALDAIHTQSNPKAKSWNQHWLMKKQGHCKLCVAQRWMSGKPRQGAEDEGAAPVWGTDPRDSRVRFPEAPCSECYCCHCCKAGSASKHCLPATTAGLIGRISASAKYTWECIPGHWKHLKAPLARH